MQREQEEEDKAAELTIMPLWNTVQNGKVNIV